MKFLALLCMGVLVGCAAPVQDEAAVDTSAQMEADIQAVKALEAAWDVANNAGDTQGIVALLTDDAIVMYANRPALVGKEAIGSDQQAFFDKYRIENSTGVVEEVQVAGDWAFARGIWTGKVVPREEGDSWDETGKWIDIFRRQADGSWKISRNMYSQNHPVPTTAG